MNNVLSVTFPQPVPLFLDFISFLFLDVRKLIRLECAKRVFLMPVFSIQLLVCQDRADPVDKTKQCTASQLPVAGTLEDSVSFLRGCLSPQVDQF